MVQIALDLETLVFKNGLIPAVIQDHQDKTILMVAYMNSESLQLSLTTGETHFWSRSRRKLWRKGESSGHIQKIKKIHVDCDQDTLLIEVEQLGSACHTGARTCFFRSINPEGQLIDRREDSQSEDAEKAVSQNQRTVLERLVDTIRERKDAPSGLSYTSQLMQGGIDRILKKVGEEAGEFIIAAKNEDRKEIVHETADLIYHLLVTLGYLNISFTEVEAELSKRTSRSGLEEKASREK